MDETSRLKCHFELLATVTYYFLTFFLWLINKENKIKNDLAQLNDNENNCLRNLSLQQIMQSKRGENGFVMSGTWIFFGRGVQTYTVSMKISQVAVLNNVCWLLPWTIPLKSLNRSLSVIVIPSRKPQAATLAPSSLRSPKWRKTSLAQWAISPHLSTHERIE